MNKRELPVLNFAPFRKFPTKLELQEFSDERQVCHGCVSGVCCANQDAIALTSFDIFRLAAFFDMSPAQFMLNFTQDEFDGEDKDLRRNWNNDPNSSVVTWLRRRENFGASPCIFLKYIRDADGTPHRICGVHDGRPLSCREYYYTHCKTRGTGELAALLAEGFEKVRDEEITEAMVDAELSRFGGHDYGSAPLARSLEYGFWVEMKYVLNMDQANVEGSNSYDMAAYQDPIDEKLNRVLSAKYLRSEESYGPKPNNEQLMPYTSGLVFAGSAEYERIMAVRRNPPSTGIFKLSPYPYWVGMRTMVPGVPHASVFDTIPDVKINDFLRDLPTAPLFPGHDSPDVRAITLRDIYSAVLKAFNHLIRFSSHVTALAPILECDPPGTLESELFTMIGDFETSLNPFIARNPYFQPVKERMAAATFDRMEEDISSASSPEEVFDGWRRLCRVWGAISTLPRGPRRRAHDLDRVTRAKLQKGDLALYVREDNPVGARRAASRRLGGDRAWRAWAEWYAQVLDMRYAALAGFTGVNLPAFYRRAVDDLVELPFRSSYADYLYEAVKCLGNSMSLYNHVPYRDMPFKDAAERLADYAVRLYDWMDAGGNADSDCESLAEYLSAACRGLGRGYNCDRHFGLAVLRIIGCQLEDGSWKTDLTSENAPESQAALLDAMYRATWACVNGLRPLNNDALNPKNKGLLLV